jgi:hypothetical protein
MLHVRADGVEGGGEVAYGSREYSARVADGEGDELHPSPVILEGRDEGGVFIVFFSILAKQPKSLQKPISRMMRVHVFLSKEVGLGEGVSGTPLA